MSSRLLASVLALLALALPRFAQCPQPDNLDGGPCCGLTSPQLPSIPNFKTDAQNVCWLDCGIDQVSLVRGIWKQLPSVPGVVPHCGEETMRLDIVTPSNVLLWRGNMTLTYARTFWVIETNGLARQVWRYLANGDLRPFAAAGAPPCPVPPCASAFNNRVFFTGYVDFAGDCSTPNTTFDTAWMLTHACDAFDHHAGFARAGTFHPDRSYTFVGPAAGFVPGPIQPIESTSGSLSEAMRQRVPTSAPTSLVCAYEEPAFHVLAPLNQLCTCGAPGSNQFMEAILDVQTACGGAARTPASGGLLPGFVSMGLGAWTNPNLYPGQQVLRWNIGGYDVQDACTGATQHFPFYGVTTIGGLLPFEMTANGPGNPLAPTFIDQVSAQTPLGNPLMNRPNRGYYLLNLNH